MARTTVEKICEKCGKPYQVHPCRYNESKYCSQKCYKSLNKPNVTLTCPQCGKIFTQWASKMDVCCSRKCADKMRILPRFVRDSPELLALAKDHLSYNPDTGLLTWIKRQHGRKVTIEPGTIVSWVRPDGYLQLTLRSRKLLAHRVAWAIHYGAWPKKHLDHINRNKTDNRIINLRRATQAENCHNTRTRSETGVLGVYLRKTRYYAHIGHKGKQYYIGSFATVDEAAQARKQKAIELGVAEFLPVA